MDKQDLMKLFNKKTTSTSWLRIISVLRNSLVLLLLSACSGTFFGTQSAGNNEWSILAVETFLADITRNVAGDRFPVGSLLPIGLDLHSYQPSPRDIVMVAGSNILVINGGGIEVFLSPLLENAGGEHALINASEGTPAIGGNDAFPEGDPHFWLDPINVILYAENIRDGLIAFDPEGELIYRENADRYIQKLNDLDAWIRNQVEQIPSADRKLVTNHDSLAYFARRYGFEVIGSLVPGLSSEAAPTAGDMINLVDQINASGAKVIFLETGSGKKFAEQIAGETDVTLVTDLYIGSLSGPNGPAPTYIDMMKYNVNRIVDALK